MVDLEYLSKLLTLLRSNGALTFKNQGLELSFASASPQIQEKVSGPGPAQVPIQPQQVEMPPEFKSDEALDFDKILNWSGSPDPLESQELPLTGDQTLEV